MRKIPVVLASALIAAGLAAPRPASAQGFGLGSLYSCDTPGSGDTTGAIIGGLVGGLAGSQISKNERALGAVAGAAIGAAIGNSIGCRMNRQSRERAQDAFSRALETGRAQTWADEESGASGRVEVIEARGWASRSWRFDEGVARISTLRGGGGAYEAVARINVRAAPGVDAPVVDRLRNGERISVAGEARAGWLAVEEDGVVLGYVSASGVRPLGRPSDRPGYASRDGCRVVEETRTMRGYAPEIQRYNACRDAAGAWRLTAI